MMTSTLAGCTGGDPDSGGEIDADALNDLIDQNLQDFINNTTITVNQEIHHHYYNNTTNNDYNTEYNNTTVNEGDSIVNEGDDNNLNEWSNTSYNLGGANFGNGVNGTVYSGSNMMFVAHLEFDAYDIFPDIETAPEPSRNSVFSYVWTYYDYLSNSNRTDVFTFSCQVFYLVGSQSNNTNNSQVSFFDNDENYHDAWSNEYNGTVADMLESAGLDSAIASICDESYVPDGAFWVGPGFDYTFFTIDIPMGYAIQYIQLDHSHTYYGCYYPLINQGGCRDNYGDDIYRNQTKAISYLYSEGPSPDYSNTYYGGWENISVDFNLNFGSIIWDSWDQNCPDGCWYGYDENAVWPTSEYLFTLYYQFVPVIPTE